MSKSKKIILLIVSITVVLIIVAYICMLPDKIATYNSPDGEYSLVFEQMGSPEWPFGATDVRLTLKDNKGKKINRVSTQVHNDGVDADEWNIKSITWNDDDVVVVLRSAEAEDEEISIAYKKR